MEQHIGKRSLGWFALYEVAALWSLHWQAANAFLSATRPLSEDCIDKIVSVDLESLPVFTVQRRIERLALLRCPVEDCGMERMRRD
jgi:hypothetical protein